VPKPVTIAPLAFSLLIGILFYILAGLPFFFKYDPFIFRMDRRLHLDPSQIKNQSARLGSFECPIEVELLPGVKRGNRPSEGTQESVKPGPTSFVPNYYLFFNQSSVTPPYLNFRLLVFDKKGESLPPLRDRCASHNLCKGLLFCN
jgi:hypothetical protein